MICDIKANSYFYGMSTKQGNNQGGCLIRSELGKLMCSVTCNRQHFKVVGMRSRSAIYLYSFIFSMGIATVALTMGTSNKTAQI